MESPLNLSLKSVTALVLSINSRLPPVNSIANLQLRHAPSHTSRVESEITVEVVGWLIVDEAVEDALPSPLVHSKAHSISLKVASGCGLEVEDALPSPLVRSEAHSNSLKVASESKLEVEDAALSGVKVEVGDRGELGVRVELGDVVWFELAGGDGNPCGDGKTKVLVGELGDGVAGDICLSV